MPRAALILLLLSLAGCVAGPPWIVDDRDASVSLVAKRPLPAQSIGIRACHADRALGSLVISGASEVERTIHFCRASYGRSAQAYLQYRNGVQVVCFYEGFYHEEGGWFGGGYAPTDCREVVAGAS